MGLRITSKLTSPLELKTRGAPSASEAPLQRISPVAFTSVKHFTLPDVQGEMLHFMYQLTVAAVCFSNPAVSSLICLLSPLLSNTVSQQQQKCGCEWRPHSLLQQQPVGYPDWSFVSLCPSVPQSVLSVSCLSHSTRVYFPPHPSIQNFKLASLLI